MLGFSDMVVVVSFMLPDIWFAVSMVVVIREDHCQGMDEVYLSRRHGGDPEETIYVRPAIVE